MKLSVAMTTYNGMAYLPTQLNSLLAQHVLPDEIVIADDCSDDGTREFLRDAARTRSPLIRLFENDHNLGWKANFMQAVSQCTGDVIAFCDQDDFWLPEKIKVVREVFSRDRPLLVYHDANVVDRYGERIGAHLVKPHQSMRPEPPLTSDMWAPILGFSMAISRDLLHYDSLWNMSVDKLNCDERAPHDQWYQFLATSLGTSVHIDRPLVDYRIHGKNSMGLRTQRRGMADLRAALQTSLAKVESRVTVAENRVMLLTAMLETKPPRHLVATRRAIAAYAEHAEFNRSRLAMYHCRAPLRRVARWFRLLRSPAYRGHVLPLSRDEKVRDLFMAAVGVNGSFSRSSE